TAGAHLCQYVLWLLAWWFIGEAALQGRFDPGWFAAWAIVLLGLVPFRSLVTWSQGAFAILAGGLLKQRLLHGALKLDTEQIRHLGSGQMLGRVLESEAVESLALSGGFLGLVAAMELVAAAIVLSLGAGGWLQVALLAGWIAFAFLLAGRYFQHRLRWTGHR